MKKLQLTIFILLLVTSCKISRINDHGKEKITVAAYYFPNYHTDDPRNIINKGRGWSEWELVKQAKPRFKDHHQPNIHPGVILMKKILL